MKIIITGGAGFLGHHLSKALLNAGHQIKIIDLKKHTELPTDIADVRDQQKMLTLIKDAEVVFHLASLIEAGESVRKPQLYVDNNINGTISVLEAMRQNNIKNFIFSSSAAIYGEPQNVPIKEDDPTLPINPYGVTKLAMEGFLNAYVQAYEFTGIALRYFNLYGPAEHHQPESHAIPRFIKQIYEDQPVTVWGSGQNQRDYVYIDDIVKAHLKALTMLKSQPHQYHYFNLSTEQPTSVLTVIKLLEQALNKKATIKNYPDRPGDSVSLYADASKAREVLGWTAQTKIDSGLKKTVEYFVRLWKNNDQNH